MSTPDYTYLRQRLRRVSDNIVCGTFSKNETVAALLEAETALGHLMYVCRYYEVKAEAGETPEFRYLPEVPSDGRRPGADADADAAGNRGRTAHGRGGEKE